MRILVIGSLEHQDSFAYNIVENLRKLGNETITYDTQLFRVKINNEISFRINQIISNFLSILSGLAFLNIFFFSNIYQNTFL